MADISVVYASGKFWLHPKDLVFVVSSGEIGILFGEHTRTKVADLIESSKGVELEKSVIYGRDGEAHIVKLLTSELFGPFIEKMARVGKPFLKNLTTPLRIPVYYPRRTPTPMQLGMDAHAVLQAGLSAYPTYLRVTQRLRAAKGEDETTVGDTPT